MMKELSKTILLILLIISTLYLTLRTWVYDPMLLDSPSFYWAKVFLSNVGIISESTPVVEAEIHPHIEAVPPLKIASSLDGESYGAFYDDVSAFSSQYGVLLAEALSTARPPVQISYNEWLNALNSDNIYYEYENAIPLNVLASWYSAECSLSDAADRIVIYTGSERAYLVYRTGTKYFRCETGLPNTSTAYFDKDSLVACYFASKTNRAIDTLLPNENPEFMLVEAQGAPLSSSYTAAFLQMLSISPATISRYSLQGYEGYVDNTRTCRISSEGIVYRNTTPDIDDRLMIPENTLSGQIEAARTLVNTLSVCLGDAFFFLEDIETNDNNTKLLFLPRINGIPIELGAYALVEISGNIITSVTAYLRHYTLLDTTTTLLQPKQALALLDNSSSALSIYYMDNNNDTLKAQWYINVPLSTSNSQH